MAAPTKCTPELTEEIVQILRAGNYIEVACDYVGISARTYHYWVERARNELKSIEDGTRRKVREKEAPYVAFLRATTRARRSAEVQSVARIRRAGEEDWKADAWFLERSYQNRWGRTRHDIEMKVETTTDLEKLTPQERVALIKDQQRQLKELGHEVVEVDELKGLGE